MKRILVTLAVASSLAVAALGIARAQDEADVPDGFDEEVAGAMLAEGDGPGMMGEFAHGGPMGHGRGMGIHRAMGGGMLGPEGVLLRGGGWIAEELDLSTAQRDKLRTIGDTLARKRIRLRADLDLARLDLRSMMHSESPSVSQLGTKIDAVTRIQGDMMKAGVSARLDARKVLTPEQLEKLLEMRPMRARGERGERGERGGRGPRGGN